jgi:hypothetical protein
MVLIPLGSFPLTLGGDGQGACVVRVRKVPANYTGGITPGDRLVLSALSYA